MLSVGSVCSGAGGFDLGLHRAGLRTHWFCEIDPYRRRILNRHFPGVPVHPDLTTLDPAELAPVDVLAGGTPCQDLSVGGKRAGLAGGRSGLFYDFVRVRNHIQPKWTIWENVEGALSSHSGRDFAVVLGAMVGAPVHAPRGPWASAGVATGPLGSAAWRVLDSQWFGVPQRRRRVFVVADLGGVCAAEVLIEREGGDGNPAARDQAGTAVAAAFGASVAGTLGAHKSGGTDATDLERGGAYGSSRSTRHEQGGQMTTTREPDTLSPPRSPQAVTPDQTRPDDAAKTTPTSLSLSLSDAHQQRRTT